LDPFCGHLLKVTPCDEGVDVSVSPSTPEGSFRVNATSIAT
jgi:hypothetical protein